MNIDVNRINCCTIGEYYHRFEAEVKKWKESHQNCVIVHMMQTQEDKFVVVTIWYRMKGEI